ncbi:class I adenylate-forming enzyme family protein [Ramlibacter sp. WS9]|uniref:class I adenylate-forming enzyme family protein n=1 Tax=Ramlibacter sp. WS9 TaxID=1882741 RepID=UPI00114124D7|nr:AMP-binding protein [Ramlibacter sp. WS9]ROZ62938.1 long-chain fatty acid--CoA ligase [Ramlibacter sp. WS9]
MAVPSLPSPLAAALDAHALSRPGAVALSYEGTAVTYGEITARSERLAAQLWHGWGVRAGDRVAWLGANHPGQIELLFALARIGALLLPLNFRLAPAEWDVQLAECGPAHLVHDEGWGDAARQLGARAGVAVHAVDTLGQEGDFAQAPAGGDASSPVLLVYTSGTTSRPKAAVHTQANLLANMQIACGVQLITPQDLVATMLPLFHVGGLCIQTLPALYAGAQVILHPRFNADAAFDCFEQERATLTLQVPATMKALLEHPRWAQADLASLRAVWAGSSLIPQPLVQAFHARGLPVCNVYGATETGPFSIALPLAHAMDHVGSSGWPAPGVEVRLHEVKDGTGELLIRGPNVVARYWPDQPACDAQGWFHTGDLATQAADGSYTVVGRAKDLIISGGENIHPAEIEAILAEHPTVAECAAFGLPDAEWGEVVAVAVVCQPGLAATERELKAHLAGRLARFKLPRRWFFMDLLPKTALGKIQRGALEDRFR